ncbi:MAG TPA: tetratricopeptide repeat protein [Methylomirabilota bacterium]|nr:tetratricopeptide repeat protein [Methylomirabilota bacterium]
MSVETETRSDWPRICLIVLALSYALLAGLHTVSDFDLGWQLATGRYLVEHHQIPRVELFSYTAHGNEWIYPPFSGAIFYLLHLAGGYGALSWLGTLACAATITFLCSAGKRATAALAFIAVPAIAFRTIPRAELFTTVLFAVVLAVVWRNHTGKRVRLWLLPVIFLLWANLHPGFISGLGILCAGILFELCDLIFAERRAAALERLKQLTLWLVAAISTTLVNPWGWRIYEAIYRQNRVMNVHSALINEWSAVHFNSLAWRQAWDARNPASADWWLLAIGVVAIFIALSKKRFGPAIVLASGAYLSLQHIRLQALFAILVAVIAGGIFHELIQALESGAARSNDEAALSRNSHSPSGRMTSALATVGVALLSVLGLLRVVDLVSDRYYLDSEQLSLFGTGASWWYPERAASFLERERLPRNLFHDYGQGGYLTWRVGAEYPDFVDGRYIPFGKDLFAEQTNLMSALPDSVEWKHAADHWKINTLLFPIARYAGLGRFPLQEYCESKEWKLVYLDEVSVVFVRNRPESAEVIRKFPLSCMNAPIEPPAATIGNSYRAKAEHFNYLMNAGSVFYVLGRDAEAASALTQAEQLFPENPNLHLVKAQFIAATQRPEDAEHEYLRVLRSSPSDAAWYALARLYSAEHRYAEAVRCVREAVPLSQIPHERLRALGVLYLYMNRPQDALAAFQRAEKESPYRADSADMGMTFRAQLAEGRARAYRELNDINHALEQQELAVRLNANNAPSWVALAELYEAKGQTEKAAQTREKAKSLQPQKDSSAKSPEQSAAR